MLKRFAVALLAAAVFGSTSANAECSQLAAMTDEMGPFQIVSLDVTGSTPNAPTVLVVGPNAGETTIERISLTLGLDRPFAVHFLGVADGNGDLSRTFRVPASLDFIVHAQAVGVERTLSQGAPPSLGFCTSNVVTVEL